MAQYQIENLSFCYPGAETYALQELSFAVPAGSFTVLLGPSGCGKTTLLRLLKPQLQPGGTIAGIIRFDGKPLEELSLRESSERIGFVQQNPETQIVTDKVWHELAFGLESLGLETAVIRRRVAEMASFFGIQTWFHKDVAELSGGQKQLLNLAAVMVMQPEVLILDEPTSQLDPIAAAEFLNMLERLNRELGTTIILSEHRLEQVLPMADQAIVLERGRLRCAGEPGALGKMLAQENSSLLCAWPAALQVWAAVDGAGAAPLSIREGRAWLRHCCAERTATGRTLLPLPPEQLPEQSGETAIEAKNVWFRYTEEGTDVVSGLQLRLPAGSFSALLGGNGAGKTTALKLMAGVLRPFRGKIRTGGKTGMLPQNPQTLFLKNTLQEDLLTALDGQAITAEDKQKAVEEVVRLTQLKGLLSRHPYDLSGGEQHRAALAKLLLCKPEILLLDEPTRGMDAEFKATFAEILKNLQKAGKTILMVSHDVEFCARYCDHCYLFFDGSIAADGTPRSFFAGNSFYTTACSRMARGLIPGAVTVQDLIACLGGTPPEHGGKISGKPPEPEAIRKTGGSEESNHREDYRNTAPRNAPETSVGPGKSEAAGACKATPEPATRPEADSIGNGKVPKKTSVVRGGIPDADHGNSPAEKKVPPAGPGRRRILSRGTLSAAVILLLIPLTLWVGLRFFSGRKYYFISLLILLEAVAPFFVRFERRKPPARELVVLAVLCALGVAGRAIFFMLPQFKPVMALTILAGAAMGAESGFLVGSMTMLASNMLFSQGPWTPWQMFAMGLTGFLAGLLFCGGRTHRPLSRLRKRLPLSLYGVFAAIVIYGGIMNPASALMWSDTLNPGILLTYYISGFPMDCVQAAATAVFLWLLAEPMLEKLQRVQVKYGLPVFSRAV